jgi:glycosyltransferase involved in cell wall biosynthesis
MKRVLIISYYWPPNGGAGVYRWLKMSKYLPEHGWQPVVYTPANPEMAAEDPGLLKDVGAAVEVIKHPITEPFSLYKRFTGRRQDERVQTAFLSERGSGGWKEDLALWVRSNFFVPDARVWWVRPSVRHLTAYLRQHPVDAIVSTGPPHSMHLIAQGVKRATGIPWLADFRDPWTDIDYYGQLKLSKWADRRHHRMERAVLQDADAVVTVSWSWAKDLARIGGRPVEVITNGYDPADVPAPPEPVDERWSLVHVGSMSATRDMPGLWQGIATRMEHDAELRERFVLRFIGPVDHSVLESVTASGLGAHIERMGRLNHADAMRAMQRARVLLLPINDTPNSAGILPGKLYEYLSVGRPIVAVGPAQGDVARVLGGAHLLLPRDADADGVGRLRALLAYGAPPAKRDPQYDRRELAGRMGALLDGLG